MKVVRRLAVFLVLVLLQPVTGYTGTITTPEIVAQTTTAALSCMQWMPTGVCFWLHCTVTGCSVRTSIKVGHYNPDLVVSAYNELGGNPWAEIRATLGLAQQAAATGLLGSLLPIPVDSAGNRTEGTAARDHQNLIYRETDAIGHPLSSLSGLVSGVGLLCPSETTSFVPYFQSGLDALSWRQEVPEIFYPASFIPGLARDRQLAPANLGRSLSAHRLDHPGRRTQGRGHQRPARRRHRHAPWPAARLYSGHRFILVRSACLVARPVGRDG